MGFSYNGDGGLEFDENEPLPIDIVGGNNSGSGDSSGGSADGSAGGPTFGGDGGSGVNVGADPGGGSGDSNWTQQADGNWRNRTTGEIYDVKGGKFTMPGGTPTATQSSPKSSGSGGSGTTVNNNNGGTTIGGGSSPAAIAAAIAAALSAHQLDKASGQYTTLGEKYAGQLDPYGAYRHSAADKLAALQADPSSIADTPGYKFALQEGLGAVGNRDNRSFGVGAGSTNPDLMRFAQGLASKTYNDQIKQYQDEAGVGIGPGAAASVLQTGMTGSIQAKLGANAALGAIPGLLTNPTYSSNGSTGDSVYEQLRKSMFGGATDINKDIPPNIPSGDNTTTHEPLVDANGKKIYEGSSPDAGP